MNWNTDYAHWNRNVRDYRINPWEIWSNTFYPTTEVLFRGNALRVIFASFEFVANLLLLLPRQHSSQVCFSIVWTLICIIHILLYIFLKFNREIATAVQSPQTPQSATLTDDEGAISQIIAETNFAAINSPTLPSVEIAVKKMLWIK